MSVEGVLVIEDHEAVGETLCEVVRFLGPRASLCRNTDEGLELITRMSFDLIFINFGLPMENGVEGARRIHRTIPEIPIVLITGWMIEFDPEVISGAGITRVLWKPSGLSDIAEIIKYCVV